MPKRALGVYERSLGVIFCISVRPRRRRINQGGEGCTKVICIVPGKGAFASFRTITRAQRTSLCAGLSARQWRPRPSAMQSLREPLFAQNAAPAKSPIPSGAERNHMVTGIKNTRVATNKLHYVLNGPCLDVATGSYPACEAAFAYI